MDFQGYLTLTILSFLAGVASRPNLEQAWHKFFPPARPARRMRAESRTFGAEVQAVILEPAHRFGLWKTYMRAFLFHAEMCKPPMSFRQMEDRIGISSRQQKYYRNVLIDGGVIRVVQSGGVYWMKSWDERRNEKVLNALPYPTQFDPPIFPPRKPSQLKRRVTVQRSA